jgi:pyruvate dehydrogenase complex dehydrogenase (E1) component
MKSCSKLQSVSNFIAATWEVLLLKHGRELTETLKHDDQDQSIEFKVGHGLTVQFTSRGEE